MALLRLTRFMQVFAEYQKACAQVRTLFVVRVWLFVCHHDIELQPSCAFAFAFHKKKNKERRAYRAACAFHKKKRAESIQAGRAAWQYASDQADRQQIDVDQTSGVWRAG